jgi:RNA polymerase sigma-70 factor (ECF subfamily)
VYGRCRRAGLHSADAADVTQDVFRRVAAAVARFRRESPQDSFRAWLGVIIRNAILDFHRRQARLSHATGGSTNYERLHAVADSAAAFEDDGALADDSERRAIVRRSLALIQVEFTPTTWSAFWRTTVDGASPAVVAEELQISTNAVYKAKSRVLKRLREELDGLIN